MPEKLDRCVDKVKGKKGIDNAYAICNASIDELDDKLEDNLSEFAIPNSLSAVSIGDKKVKEAFDKMYKDLMNRDAEISTAVKNWAHS